MRRIDFFNTLTPMEIRLRALLPLFFLMAVVSQKGAAQCSLNPPLFLGNDTLLCEGSVINAGTGYVSHLWQNGSTAQTFAVDSTGWKYVTVIDSFGCTGTDSVFVTVQQRPTAHITPSNGQLLCLGDTIELESYDPGVFAYLWNDSLTSSNRQVIVGGTYFVIVFDALGCTDTSASVVITSSPKPVINIIPPGPYNFCDGDTLYVTTVSPEHLSYLWNDGYTSGDRYLTMSGNYQVTIQDSSGCADTSQVIVVTFHPLPLVILGPDDTICTGETLTLNAGSFASYLWSSGATTQTIDINSGGGYAVTVTDANNCSAVDIINITELWSPQVNIGLDKVFCGVQSFLLDAGPGFSSYLWSTGATTQTINVTSAGSYSVTVTTSVNGCSGTSNTVMVTGDSNTVAPISLVNLILSTTTFSTYQWYFNGTAIPGANSMTFLPSAGGDYYVMVTTPSGCVLVSDTIPVVLTITKESIPQGFSPNSDGTNDVFDIPGIMAYPDNELIIFNRWGSEVYRKKGYTGNWNGESNNGKVLEESTYFYTLDLGNGKDTFSGYIMIRR